MTNRFQTYCNLLILLLLLVGCSKTENVEENPFPIITDYYPGKIGSFIDYKVDSIYHNNALEQHDTVHYKIRELLESNFTDNQGRNSIRIERYISHVDSTNWILKDIWFSTTTNVRMEKIEEDVRFIKLINPIQEDEAWNGNAMNILDEWEYNYLQIAEPFFTDSLNFDSTITVLQRDYSNLIEKEYAKEIFAKNIGMIYKYSKLLRVNPNFNELLPDTADIDSGVEYTMKAINYGQL
jgi:hypothetical protein